jgi:hypothetical protein
MAILDLKQSWLVRKQQRSPLIKLIHDILFDIVILNNMAENREIKKKIYPIFPVYRSQNPTDWPFYFLIFHFIYGKKLFTNKKCVN